MDRKISTPPLSERHPPPVVRMNATKYTPPAKRSDDLDEDTLPPLPPNLKRADSCPVKEDNWTKVKTKKQSRASR